MSIEMTTTTDHAEIRNSADDDGQFEFLGILSRLADENRALTAAIERVKTLALELEQKAPMCGYPSCPSCMAGQARDRNYAAAIRRALAQL